MSRSLSVVLATLIVLPAFVLLIALGVWQVHRLAVKQEFMAQRNLGFSQAPVELPGRDGNLQSLAWRRVSVSGRFDHDHEFHLWSIGRGQAGYEVLTPLVRSDGAAGQIVLVDRGWIPIDRKAPAARAAGQVAGEVTVRGFVRIDLDGRSAVTPANDVAGNIWYAVDYPEMSRQSGHFLRTLVVVADATANPGGVPVGINDPPAVSNRHLGYAITWFSLALVLVVIYGLALRRRFADNASSG